MAECELLKGTRPKGPGDDDDYGFLCLRTIVRVVFSCVIVYVICELTCEAYESFYMSRESGRVRRQLEAVFQTHNNQHTLSKGAPRVLRAGLF